MSTLPGTGTGVDRVPTEVDKRVARLFLLLKHKLLPPRSQWGKHGVLRIFEHLRCIQEDGIDVVGRTPDVVLQSRVADYKPEILNELLYQDRLLIEYYDKGLSVLPMEDLWIFANRFDYYRQKHSEFTSRNDSMVRQLTETIKYHGPLSTVDIESDEKVPLYWEDSKFTRNILEVLWECGELAINRREGPNTYYDLVRRIVPERLRKRMVKMPVERYLDFKMIRRINAVGMLPTRGGGPDVWLLVGKSDARAEAGRRLKEAGAINTLGVKGSRNRYMYLTKDLPLLQAAAELGNREDLPSEVSFLAPFDNLLWDSVTISDLFGFNLVFEADKQPGQRMYGFYSMPVLYGDRLVGRIDPRYNKNDYALELGGLFWEEGFDIEADQGFLDAFVHALIDFMAYLGAQHMRLNEEAPPMPRSLTQALKKGGVKIRR